MTQLSPTALEAAAKAISVSTGDEPDKLTYAREMQCSGADREPQYRWQYWTEHATAAITAYLAQAGKEGWVMVPNSALAWLFGEGPDADGHWFEPPEIKEGERKKPYWWRSKFRAMLAAAQNGGDLPAPPMGK